MTINRAQFFQIIAGAIAGLFGIKKATAGPAIPLRPTGASASFNGVTVSDGVITKIPIETFSAADFRMPFTVKRGGAYRNFPGPVRFFHVTGPCRVNSVRIQAIRRAPVNQITFFNPEDFKGVEVKRVYIEEISPAGWDSDPWGFNDPAKMRRLNYLFQPRPPDAPIIVHEGDRIALDVGSNPASSGMLYNVKLPD